MTINIEWNIESIRVTAFHSNTFDTRSLETWLEATSENVATELNRTMASFSGVSRSTDGFVRANWSGKRFDVILTPVKPENPLAPLDDARRLFDRYVDSVPKIENLPILDRIALGLILTASVDNEEQAIELLKSAIQGLQINPSARDFLYRVNYPLLSNTKERVRINRLTTWSFGEQHILQIQIRLDGSSSQEALKVRPTAIRLELDINTDKDVRLEADSKLVAQFLSEMEKIAINIAEDGESAMLS